MLIAELESQVTSLKKQLVEYERLKASERGAHEEILKL